jgi:hypothetical protein
VSIVEPSRPAWRATVSLEDGMRQAAAYCRSDASLLAPNPQLGAVFDAICALRGDVTS